jgi:aldose 1-epimerase
MDIKMNKLNPSSQKQNLFYIICLLSLLLLVFSSCSTNGKDQMIEKTLFGKLDDGREVYLYTLKNNSGGQVQIINYGARVVSLAMPDRNGNFADIVTGYDSLGAYVRDNSYFGAIVGRYGNRIAKGKFELDGKEYQLTINDGRNSLHGGKIGFFKAFWNAEPVESKEGPSLKLSLVSPDGDEGYPGTVTATVTYTLTNNDELKIDYTGTTDKSTIFNPTHHSYFNLSGNFNNTILSEELSIDADSTTPVNNELIPTGKIAPVENTPMDFRKPTPIGLHINDDNQQIKFGRGYDHNWVLNNYKKGVVRKVATLYDSASGRFMEVLTDQPGLQFYSGNFLNGVHGKNGAVYKYRTALCLEAQHYPDSPNEKNFPSVVLRPGEVYKQTTIYKFSTK